MLTVMLIRVFTDTVSVQLVLFVKISDLVIAIEQTRGLHVCKFQNLIPVKSDQTLFFVDVAGSVRHRLIVLIIFLHILIQYDFY